MAAVLVDGQGVRVAAKVAIFSVDEFLFSVPRKELMAMMLGVRLIKLVRSSGFAQIDVAIDVPSCSNVVG